MPNKKIIKIVDKHDQHIACASNTKFYIFDYEQANTICNLYLKCEPNVHCQVYYFCLNKNTNKNIKIILEHTKNNECEISINALCAKQSFTNIDIAFNINHNAINVATKQLVNCVLFDQAKCNVVPSMYVDTNQINAMHSVNVGYLNQDELFYLMSRKLTRQQATQLLIKSNFSAIDDCGDVVLSRNFLQAMQKFY
ncbi:MAG: SufD family Fe-S cluster assembly protein [Mycoplasmataceae bacterium]|jgi:Fe-S cluster assembly scaffold protein SufB|nr:SufD family Fe-S cluster assembly protein [Mycoplasmataceae bacterium]